MRVTNITDAKTQLSALVESVQQGKEVIIGKAGKPMARLVKFERSHSKRRAGSLKNKIIIHDDFDTLPHDISDSFGADR